MQNIFIRSTAGPGAIAQCRVGYFYTFLERKNQIVGMKENVMEFLFSIKSNRFVGFLENMYRGWIINLLNSF